MARRRKDPDEAPKGFEDPVFDEKEFIRKETISFRSSLGVLGWAFVVAMVSFVLWLNAPSPRTGWYLGLLLMAGMGYLLRFILPRLKVDTAHFGKKEWFGTGALFFFSWLAFIILVVNPPIYDAVPPDVEIFVTPGAQLPGESVNITLIATDNVAVDPTSLTFALVAPDGAVVATEAQLWQSPHPTIWAMQFTPDQQGTYTVQANVRDHRGGLIPSGPHESSAETPLEVGDVVRVRMSGMDAQGVGHLTTTRDAVTVEIPAVLDVYLAWLALEDGATVFLEHDGDASDEDRFVFFAEANFAGFTGGNNTFTVHVEEHASYFLANKYGIPEIVSPLVTTETFSVRVAPDVLGDRVPDLPDARDHTIQPVPAPGIVLVAVALAGLVVYARRRRG